MNHSGMMPGDALGMPGSDDEGAGFGGTRDLARLAAELDFAALPAAVVDLTKRSLLDTFGGIIGVSGLAQKPEIVRDYVRALGGKPECVILGLGDKGPTSWAAFVNCGLGYMLDCDDLGAGGHVGIATVPAAFALAEQHGGASGRDLITAIAAGMDCR